MACGWNMCMTTSRWILSAGGVLIAWLAVIAAIMRFSDAAPGAVVVLPSEGFVAGLPADVAVLSAGPLWYTVRSDMSGLAGVLYDAGALLVLPAGLPGCLPLPKG